MQIKYIPVLVQFCNLNSQNLTSITKVSNIKVTFACSFNGTVILQFVFLVLGAKIYIHLLAFIKPKFKHFIPEMQFLGNKNNVF